ncbi:MAG TPA: ATP-binding cassette domain-containing protein [Prolixibacteraceae bacterium]|nr:ABC transporter ATP-binding protein [Bacteroidales bacterium]HUM88295.1 ATP-binding cassette domain-containing protein [Prolixibacteraceae bacterium]
MSNDIAIKLENINKTYVIHDRGNTIRERFFSLFSGKGARKLKALQNVNLEIKKGEFFGIIGRNGSGKSTLVQIMNEAIPPDKGGKVTIDGKAMRLALGMGFNNELTARQNIMINSSVLGLSIKEIKSKMDEMIAFAELEEFADTPVKYYSSGMKSKLMFSIAVNAEADIFLMDEFFGGVGDQNFKKKADELFHNRFVKGKTIIHVSHQMDSIKKYCDRVMLLDKGKVVKIGTPDEVLAEY